MLPSFGTIQEPVKSANLKTSGNNTIASVLPRCEEAKLPAQEMLRISLWYSPANHFTELFAKRFIKSRGFALRAQAS